MQIFTPPNRGTTMVLHVFVKSYSKVLLKDTEEEMTSGTLQMPSRSEIVTIKKIKSIDLHLQKRIALCSARLIFVSFLNFPLQRF